MKERSHWYLILCVLFLVGCSITTLYSITSNLENALWKKQAIWAFIGTIGLFSASLINYQILKRYAVFIYIISIILLIAVLFMPPIRFARSWFTFPYFSFQPSEFAKLSTIIMLSFYLKDKGGKISSISSFAFPFIIILIPVFLILLQPDLGTSFIFFPIIFSMLYILEPNRTIYYGLVIFFLLFCFSVICFSFLILKGYSLNPILILISALSMLSLISSIYTKKKIPFILFLCSISLIASLGASKALKDYQKKRFLVFLDQSFDPLGAGYNITQSKIAIGGGRIFGAGFLKGPQSHLGFLPEKASDFIFSAYAEEWGFIGVFFLVSTLFAFITIGFSIAKSSLDVFAVLLASGITSMIAISAFINIGICCGILPVTGIPLPFVSYGGSSLVCHMTSVGILISIKRWARR